MGILGITEKDCLKQISKEEKRIIRLEQKMKDLEFDIKATRGAIEYWNEQLKRLQKKNLG